MSFEVTILGNGAALPTATKHPAAHVLNVREQFYLIDCGEGTQIQLIRAGINPQRIHAVFISHLHGDHLYGLFPLISTLALQGRQTPLRVFGPNPLGEIIDNHLRYFDTGIKYEIIFTPVDTRAHSMIFENKVMEVYSVPLRHRVPACGYMFREKTPELNVRKEMIDLYALDLKQILAVKRGEDIITESGETIPNGRLSYLPYTPRSYAYLSDTQFSAKAAATVNGADLLYHEATFRISDKALARQTGHSTTADAAKAALKADAGRLLIGHISNRYKNTEEVIAEVRSIFPNSDIAAELQTYKIEKKR